MEQLWRKNSGTKLRTTRAGDLVNIDQSVQKGHVIKAMLNLKTDTSIEIMNDLAYQVKINIDVPLHDDAKIPSTEQNNPLIIACHSEGNVINIWSGYHNFVVTLDISKAGGLVETEKIKPTPLTT